MRKVHFAALAISVAAVSPALAIDPVYDNPSDLILGFISAGATSNVEINLGAPLQFKTGQNGVGSTNLFLGNIGLELTAAFGATWYDSVGAETLLFGIAGASNSSSISAGTANANLDFNSTIYASRSRTAAGTVGTANSTPWSGLTAANVTTAAGGMVSQGNTFAANHGGDGILTIANSASNDWSNFNPVPSGSPAYSTLIGTDGISFRLGAGQFGGTGEFDTLTNVEGVVDLYRIVRFTNGGGAVGTGDYLGSLAISQNGDINYVVVPVPEPGTALMAGLSLVGLALRRRREPVIA